MQSIKQHPVMILTMIVAVLSLACGPERLFPTSSANIDPTPTRTPLPTFTPAPSQVVLIPAETQPQEQAPAAEETQVEPTPTATLVVITPTDTPTPEVANVAIVQNMNVRGGPGTNYHIIGAATSGEVFKILGKTDDGNWFQVAFPNAADGLGWIFGPLVQVNGDTGPVAIAQAPPPPPPPPTPTPEPAPANPAPAPEPVKQYQFTPDGFWGSENAAIVHFKGRFKDEGGNLVNGYSVLIDNGAFRIVSHPSGASHHYPEKGDGEWDIVIPDPSSGVGWWWLTVVRYDCPDFLSRFDAQCTQYTKLSEDIKILVNWPDETVVNANWTCHWDCDKGLYANAFRR